MFLLHFRLSGFLRSIAANKKRKSKIENGIVPRMKADELGKTRVGKTVSRSLPKRNQEKLEKEKRNHLQAVIHSKAYL